MDFNNRNFRSLLFLFAATSLVAGVRAAETGSISGTVKTHDGTAAAGADVALVQLSRHATADAAGTFRFDAVPPGQYLIEIVSPRFGSVVGQVLVKPGEDAAVAFEIDLTVHHEDVIVSASVSAQSLGDSATSVSVLDERELTAKAAVTIGETLGTEPGVSQTQYAPGASRPVIRGLGGDRIRVLQDAIGVGDASNISADHAVTYDPFSADRVEIVRGAATLLYGSNAVGGVVNMLDRRIPDYRTGKPIAGEFSARYGSVNDLGSGAFSLGGDSGPFGWDVEYSKTNAGNTTVGSGSTFANNVIPNSDVETQNWSVGASWLGKAAFAGGAYDEFETNYGSAVERAVRVDMHQKRWDVRGGINEPFGVFRLLKVRLGGTDYEHDEIDDGVIGTRFGNKSYEGRVELGHKQAGPCIGSFGIHLWHRDFEAIGDEAFVQPTTTAAGAVFAFEEVGTGAVKAQFGLRFEQQDLTSVDPTLTDRYFSAPSASAGILWDNTGYAVASTLSYSSRVPTAEELYANGPHIATASFETGDDALGLENSLGLELVMRKSSGRVEGSISLFGTKFQNYIYERDTGTTVTTDEGNVLTVIRFSSGDATFYGGEAHVDFGLLHTDPHHLDLELRGDYVHSELTNVDQPVPLQPPLRGSLALRYQGRAFWASVEAFHAWEQNRFAPFDSATPAYTWVNATVGYRLVAGRTVHDFILRGLNLTDDLSYNSVSRFRFDVPLPGRDLSLAYHLEF